MRDVAPPHERLISEFAECNKLRLQSFVLDHVEKKPVPDLLYHYTDYAGLKGILESGTLRLSDAYGLNDPTEIEYGFIHAYKKLERDQLTGSASYLLQRFQEFKFRGGIRDTASFFVCSLSGKGDDLEQWRSYADNGRGYAIAFDGAALDADFIRDSGPGPIGSTFHVTYSDTQLHAIVDAILDKAKEIISEVIEHDAMNSRSILNGLFAESINAIVQASLLFKHEAYRNEDEYRFLRVFQRGFTPETLSIRLRPYSINRYIEYDWKSDALNSIKVINIGPCAGDIGERFANDCRRFFVPSDLPLATLRSTITYRP